MTPELKYDYIDNVTETKAKVLMLKC